MTITEHPVTLQNRLEESERLFADTGRYYGVEDLALRREDPIRYELFHSRILSACISAREAARQISASPMTRDFEELLFALFTPEGDSICFSTGLLAHVHTIGRFIKWMVREGYEADPEINEGDIFANNDTQIGNVHTPDVYDVVPIFHEGELVGWAGGVTHVLETGGITPGGMAPIAAERFTEGLIVSAEKVGTNDRLRRDYEIRLQRNLRQPLFWVLDEKAKIAGSVMIREEVKRVIGEFGLDYYKQASREIIEEGRQIQLRRVAERLVPGRYRSSGFMDMALEGKPTVPKASLDSIAHLPMSVEVARDGTISVDFDGASEWGWHSFNCSAGSMEGGFFLSLAQTLAFDGRVNDGMHLATELKLPAGSWADPQNHFASTAVAWGYLLPSYAHLFKCLSRAFYARGFHEEILAPCAYNSGVEYGGTSQFGTPFGGLDAEVAAMGGGARGTTDGLDAGYVPWNPEGDQGNAEVWEIYFPILYLGRQLLADSGGSGRNRGGSGWEALVMAWKTQDLDITGIGCVPGTRIVPNWGVFGGYPGPPTRYGHARNTDMKDRIEGGRELPHGGRDLTDEKVSGEIVAQHDSLNVFALGEYDLFSARYGPGGGGLGDPLERDAEAVVRDVELGHASVRAAEAVYGVLVESFEQDGAVRYRADLAEVDRRREKLRERRLERAVPVSEWWQKERERAASVDSDEMIVEMYRSSERVSAGFTEEYRSFWALPDDFTFESAARAE